MRDFPNGDFDICVIGESLFNHYISAVLASHGYKVAILETNEMGNTDFNTFEFIDLLHYINQQNEPGIFHSFMCSQRELPNLLKPNTEEIIEASSILLDNHDMASFDHLIKLSKKFMIDLFPFVIPTNGLTVKSIITFDVSYHISVFSPSSLWIFTDSVSRFEEVPLSRNQVFVSGCLSLDQKYFYTKFIKNCFSQTEEDRKKNLSLQDFYNQNKIDGFLSEFLYFSVLLDWNSMCQAVYNKNEFLDKLQDTFIAVKKFNTNSKYLMSINGSQDLTHCFLRRASVMGATTCYGIPIKSICKNKNGYVLNFGTSQHINAKYVLLDQSCAHLMNAGEDTKNRMFENHISYSHCILITTNNNSFQSKPEESLCFDFLIVPGKETNNHIWITRFGSGNLCPIGTNLIYFSCIQNSVNPRDDLQSGLEKYLKSYPVKVLWECFYLSKQTKPENCYLYIDKSAFLTNSLLSSSISDVVIKKANELLSDIMGDSPNDKTIQD